MSHFDFDGDEWLFFFAAAASAIVLIITYYPPLLLISPIKRSSVQRVALACLPVVALIPTYIVLQRSADPRVVGHLDYTILFMLGGGMWIFVASRFLEVLGISIRDDAIERDNLAAMVAVWGILSGVGIVYALSNIGTGATIWTTLVPGFVATVALLLMLFLVELTGGAVVDAITIDRDVASGLRMGGAVLGCAIILGHAATGDWTSWYHTWSDLATRGWPAVLIAVAAGVLQRMLGPTAHRPQPGILKFGVVPATLVVAAGFLVVVIWR
jgi:uncharacterized membrane protein YjfL (UPF0719 family)